MKPVKTEWAQRMRNCPTQAEAALWPYLAERRCGLVKFRRQAPIAGYIADFYSPELRLIVEVDGPTHDAEYDRLRDQRLTVLGYKTIRFTNEEVLRSPKRVMFQILRQMPDWSTRKFFPGRQVRTVE